MPVPDMMTVIEITKPGGPEVLKPASRPVPKPGPGEVLIKVAAAGINRPDLAQRSGSYPPPPGASDLPGLEVAGTVAAVGEGALGLSEGDAVTALTPGGGYAEYCVTPAAHCLPIPKGFDMIKAAALPETYFTVWTNVFMRGALQPGETLLVHGGASGIGTTAIQIAREWGADVILDMVAGDYVPRDMQCLAPDGRIVIIALLGGPKAEINFGLLMRGRATITGSTLRPQSVDAKAAIARGLREHVWPMLDAGKIAPVIQGTFPFADAAKGHAALEAGDHVGKFVLTLD
jgi:NADPH2:quinone reductase